MGLTTSVSPSWGRNPLYVTSPQRRMRPVPRHKAARLQGQLQVSDIRVMRRLSATSFQHLVLSALCVAGCPGTATASPDLPAGLIVLPNARNVQITKDNDGGVVYELPDAYPATAAIAELKRRLKEDGWHAVADVLNRSVPTSIGEWADFVDLSKRNEGPLQVYQWSQQWQNSNGMTTWYQLSYRGPANKDGSTAPPNLPLRVHATLLSAETLKRLQNSIRR